MPIEVQLADEDGSENCPSDSYLRDLLSGEADGASFLDAIESHLGDCQLCQERLEEIAGTLDIPTAPEQSEEFEKETQSIVASIRKKSDRPPEPLSTASVSEVDLSTRIFGESSADDASLGSIGRYRVDSLVGEGGMGLVYRGYDTELQRFVAIKVLSPTAAVSQEARDRFLREAQSAAAIVHEHVLPIHDLGTISGSGLPYLILPFVEGDSLDQIATATTLSIARIVEIIAAIASGLEAAHAEGLVHRDVKPANVLTESKTGRIFLADLGLARAVEARGDLTGTGMLLGTPQYMSPEQARGEPVDHRSDLFSLGAILYRLLSDEPPFKGESALSILREVTDHQPTPIRKLRSDTPEWLANLCHRLLHKNPDKRPQSAKHVLDAIESESAPAISKSRPTKLLPLIGLVSAVAIVGSVALLALQIRNSKTTRIENSAAAQDPPPQEAPLPTLAFQIGETRFDSLVEAIAQANSGDVVKVSGAGIHLTSPVKTNGKELTIRASVGSEPTLESTDPRSPLFDSEARLNLIGLHLIHQGLPDGASVISLRRSPLTLV
ncbi:MAG: serine/threonine-protein kinase, partial [Verrucomicrobiota bacterium]